MAGVYLDYSARKWWILVIVYVSYLCSGRYSYTLGIAFAFDVLVNFTTSSIMERDAGSIILDLVIRAFVVVLGTTVNAAFSYIFDLTMFEGNVWLYFGAVLFLYVSVKIVEPYPPSRSDDPDIRLAYAPIAPHKLKPQQKGAPRSGMYYIHYVFWIATVIYTLMYRDVVVFAEPWTYGMYFSYLVGVLALVAVAEVRGMEWWSPFMFFVFWAVVILVGYPIAFDVLKLQRKFPLKTYFT